MGLLPAKLLQVQQKDMDGGHDVRCELPISEVAITEDECVKSKGNRWIKRREFGASFCKRPKEAWTKLKHPCVFDMSKGGKNHKDCNTFSKESFSVAQPNVYKPKVSYFMFLKETIVVGEGVPATDMGTRAMPRKDIPYWYSTFKPRFTRADYNSVRKQPKLASNGRSLLFDNSATTVELQEAGELPNGGYPGSPDKNLLPMSPDVRQPGYGEKPAKMLPKKKKLSGGFYASEGNFKMFSWPKLTDPFSIDNFLETSEGASVDPVTTGSTARVMKDLKAAGREWALAKNRKVPPFHSPGPGEGSAKKACVPPEDAAKCFADVHSGKALHNGKQVCLSPADHAWFRTFCEQY